MEPSKKKVSTIVTNSVGSKKKIKSSRSSMKKASNKYQGYNFDFSKEKDKAKLQIEEEFQQISQDYEIIQSLGKGSYGIVVKALDKKNNRQVAIKKYMHLYRDKIDSKRILREIAILRRLSHPNIVKLLDILIPDEEQVDSIFLVMELCDTDLKSLLHNAKTTLSENQIKKIMFDILTGLNYLHKCGVIHRDLKPANIVVNLSTCEAKLCDFGLARDMTLEYDTEMLLNMFISNPENNSKVSLEDLKACLSTGQEIHPDVQDILQDSLETISDELFHKYSAQFEVNQEKENCLETPKNLLKEIDKDKMNNNVSSYYQTYEGSFNKDSKLRKSLTPHVITRWYRAPEVILLEPIYTSAVDIWSLGCIFGELLGKLKGNTYEGPLFPGNTCHPLSPFVVQRQGKTLVELSSDDQLISILKVLGSPTEEDCQFISNVDALEHLGKLPNFPSKSFYEKYPACYYPTIQLLMSMLRFDPRKRISTEEAFSHSYFSNIKDFVLKSNPEKFDITEKLIFLEFDKDSSQPDFEQIKQLFFDEYISFKNSKEKDSEDNQLKMEVDDIFEGADDK